MKLVKLPIRATSIVLSALLMAFMFSCSEESKLATHIPKDATAVVAFDVKSLAYKSMDFKEILKLENLKNIFSSSGEEDSIASAIRNCGLDFVGDAYIFAKGAQGAQPFGAAVLGLSDGSKFEAFLKKMNQDIAITQDGTYQTALIENSVAIGWGNGIAIVLFGEGISKEALLSVLNLDKGESLASTSETFKALEKENADISVWIDFAGIQNLVPPSAYSAATANFDLKETFMTATCNFDDGQVVVNGKYTSNGEMMKKFNFMKDNISPDVANTLPGKTVIGLMGFGLDMTKLTAYLESEKLLEAYDPSVTQFTGLSAKDLLATLSGDIGFTVNGLTMKDAQTMDWNTGQMVTSKVPDPEYCALLGIADKAKAEQVLNHFAEQGMLVKNEKFYSYMDKVFIVDQGNSYAVTGSESIKQMLLDGKGEKLSADLASLLNSNASAMYVNLNNISESFYAEGDPAIGENIKGLELEDMTFTSSGIKDNTSTSTFIVRFKPKSENSLITITRISKKYAEMMKTTLAPPAIEEEVTDEEVVEEEEAASAGQ